MGQKPTPRTASPRQSNSSPGSSLREGATSEWASTRWGKIPCRSMIPRARAANAAIWGSGNGPVAPFMPRVDQFHTDRPAVDVAFPLPVPGTRMPCPPVLRHQGEDRPVFLHKVMGADLGLLIAQALQRLPAGRHAGVVDQQDIDRNPLGPGAVVGRGEGGGWHLLRHRLILVLLGRFADHDHGHPDQRQGAADHHGGCHRLA